MKITRKVRKLISYSHGEQPREIRVIKINTNEAAYPPSAKVMRALGNIKPEVLRRYPDAESHELREALARLNNTTMARVFVGNGSDEILALMSEAFVEDDETIATLDPSYSLYKTLAAIRGVKWRRIRLRGGALTTQKDASLAIITNPNNPTGNLLPSELVGGFAGKFPGVVVVDEAYADYARWNCMELATSQNNDNLIVMRTFSKAYALAGVRIGYCVGPVELIRALYKIKDSYNVDAIAQHLALVAVKDQCGLRNIIAKVLRTRDWFGNALLQRGWRVMPTDANFVFCSPPPKIPNLPSGSTPAEFVFHALRARKIFARWFSARNTAEWIRFTIGTDSQMKRVLAALDQIFS